MSKLFKSKFLLGMLMVAAFAFTSTADAAITSTLKMGMKNAQVMELQQMLNGAGFAVSTVVGAPGHMGHETTYFGPATKAAVKAFQGSNGLVADGVFGPKSRVALGGGSPVTPSTPVTPGTPVNPQAQSGTLQVAAASTMPAAMYVPTGASTVKVGDFLFTAPSNSPVTVSTLTFKRLGVGTSSEISNAYIYDGANRLTSGRTFNSSSNEATFTVNVILPAGTSKVLSLSINTTGSTAGSHKFSLVSMSSVSVSSGVVVSGSFPITTNELTLSSITSGTIAMAKNGSLTNPRVGDKQVVVSEFKLTPATEDAMVKYVTLTQGGSIANSALSNFMLKQNGVTVATASTISSNSRLALVFSPEFKIEKGNDRVFQLYADITGRPADTVSFYFDEVADTYATGATYNYGMTPSINANMDASSDTGLTLTLQGGQFVATFTGPAAKNISNSASDVSLWEGSVYTANTVEIRNWRVRVQDTNATDPDLFDTSSTMNLQDVKIWNVDTGTIIAGPKDISAGYTTSGLTTLVTTAAGVQDVFFKFTDTYTLMAGTTTKIRITADVKNNPTGNITLLTTLGDGTNSFTQGDIKNVDSNTYLTQTTDVSPSGVIAGYSQTVTAAGLTLNTSSSPTDSTLVKGAQNTAVTAFDFVVGSGDAIKISSLTVTAGMSGTNDNSYAASGGADTSVTVADLILTAKLMDGNTPVGTTKSFSSGVIAFDNLNWTIPASTTKKLSVIISTNSSAVIVSSTDFLRISIETSGVSAVDSQGNTVTGSAALTANTAESSADVVVTVSDGGTIAVALAANPLNPASGLMYGGATMKSFAAYKFSAQNDAFYVKKLVLLPYVGGSNSANSNARISNLQVRYKNQAGSTVSSTVGLSGTSINVDISANPMYVPANGDATLEVLGDLSAFTILDGTEDMNITFALKGTDSTNNQATGVGSNADVSGGVFSATDLVGNAQYVYRTNLNVSKNTSAGVEISGVKSRSASQIVASYTYSSTGGATSSYFRGSRKAADSSITNWAQTGGGTLALITTAGNFISGSSAISTGTQTANTAGTLAFDFGATAGLTNYNRISAWVKLTGSASAGVVTFGHDDTTNLASMEQTISVGTASTTPTWYYVDAALSGVVAGTRYVGVKAAAAGGIDTVAMIVDDLRFYNDSQTVTAAGNLKASSAAHGLPFTMKDSGGTVRSYGAFNGSSTTGTVVLIPGDGADVAVATTYSDVEVTSTLTLDLYTSTSGLMLADTTANEALSVSVATGTPSSAGNFLWYDNSDTAGSNNQAGISVVNPISTTLDFSNSY